MVGEETVQGQARGIESAMPYPSEHLSTLLNDRGVYQVNSGLSVLYKGRPPQSWMGGFGNS